MFKEVLRFLGDISEFNGNNWSGAKTAATPGPPVLHFTGQLLFHLLFDVTTDLGSSKAPWPGEKLQEPLWKVSGFREKQVGQVL